ncbi:MAG: hypothetical protein HQL40_04840 [Alphaproteobacteria bacterium]|nr:hypothetical protein [Alphaproteobacteria bacterium]
MQSFVLAGGRLRDMAGASELLDRLCAYPHEPGRGGESGDLLGTVMAATGLADDEVTFSRRAGGAFTVVAARRDPLLRLRRLWTLAVRQHAPGLVFVDALAGGDGAKQGEAIRAASALLQGARSRMSPELPPLGPVTARAPRSGRPVVGSEMAEQVDAVTLRKTLETFRRGSSLGRRFLGDEADAFVWPKYLDDEPGAEGEAVFPFRDEKRQLAVIHADGNGLGRILIELGRTLTEGGRDDDYAAIFRDFSRAVDRITRSAVLRATKAVVTPQAVDTILPMRPIVLGGDDLTLILRADLAIPFCRVFLAAFRDESGRELGRLIEESNLSGMIPGRLTAGAGIVFVKARQPFHRAYDLCEELAAVAKARKDGGGQHVAFHRVGGSVMRGWADIERDELTTRRGDQSLRLTMSPYRVDGPDDGTPALDDLLRLHRFVESRAAVRGPLRELVGLLYEGASGAESHWRRWRDVLGARDREALGAFDELLARLGCQAGDDLPVDEARRTPLLDAVMLGSVGMEPVDTD